MKSKCKKTIIWAILVILLLVGVIGTIVLFIIRSTKENIPDNVTATRIYAKIQFILRLRRLVAACYNFWQGKGRLY